MIHHIEAEFTDFEDLASSIEAWDLDFYQLDQGRLEAKLMQHGVPGAHVAASRISRRMEQHGLAPEGMRTFVVAASDSSPFRWRGFDVNACEMLIFPRDRELYCVSERGFHNLGYAVSEESLIEVGRTIGCEGITTFLDSGVELLRLSPAHIGTLRRLIEQLLRPPLPDSQEPADLATWRRTLDWDLPCLLIEAIADAAPLRRERPPLSRRSLAIRQAISLVNDRRNHPVTVRMICEQTGVKQRTLQYAFQEEFGVSPKEWLKLRAIGEIRKELRHADPAEFRVADIAARWGVWHMGQFAKDYRDRFHELPSETLKRGIG